MQPENQKLIWVLMALTVSGIYEEQESVVETDTETDDENSMLETGTSQHHNQSFVLFFLLFLPSL